MCAEERLSAWNLRKGALVCEFQLCNLEARWKKTIVWWWVKGGDDKGMELEMKAKRGRGRERELPDVFFPAVFD